MLRIQKRIVILQLMAHNAQQIEKAIKKFGPTTPKSKIHFNQYIIFRLLFEKKLLNTSFKGVLPNTFWRIEIIVVYFGFEAIFLQIKIISRIIKILSIRWSNKIRKILIRKFFSSVR